LINRPGERFISKNPPNLARIKVLLEMFPEARFIFIYRNPYNVIESFYRFLQEVIPAIQLQNADEDVTRKMLASLYADMVDYYYKTKDKIPSENLMEIRYEDLAADPITGIRKIYEQFGMDHFDKDLPNIEIYLQRTRNISKNHYEISDPTIELVNKHFVGLLNRWEYPVKN